MNKPAQEMIAELQSALRDPKVSKAEFIRIQAVLLRKKKQKRAFIAELLGKSASVVEDWITAYNHRGLDGLRTKKRVSSPSAKLTPQQKEHIVVLLKQSPVKVGIAKEEYWRMSLVEQLVKRETGVVYQSETSYRKLLIRAGMSYQKVEFIDHHKNQAADDGFQKQFDAKVKGGRISMWW